MFTKSFSSLLKDTFSNELNIKYKIINITNNTKNEKDAIIKCEFIPTGKNIEFMLSDIITNNKLQFFSSQDILLLSAKHNARERSEFNNTDTINKFYYPITILFVVCLITSNVAATKLCNIGGIVIPGGTFLFPLLYVITDVLTEVYGFSASRKTIWIALLCNLLFTVFLYSIIYVPSPKYWLEQESYEAIFSLSPRIFIASIISYLLGENTNAVILSLLKLKFKGKYFVPRAIFSTFIGAFFESIIFCFVAFSSSTNFYQIISMVFSLTLIKIIYEILLMPVTVKVVGYLKYKESINVFETPTFKKLIPFIIR